MTSATEPGYNAFLQLADAGLASGVVQFSGQVREPPPPPSHPHLPTTFCFLVGRLLFDARAHAARVRSALPVRNRPP